MMKIKSVTSFDSKFVTVEDGSVYVKFNFGGFYEWYRQIDKSFSLVDVATSKKLEDCLHMYEPLKKPNIIYLDDV